MAGRLRTRDAKLLCEMQHSYAVAKIIVRSKRKIMEIAINSLQFPKCWSQFCAMQKRHSWSPAHFPCWTPKPCYKLKNYKSFWKKRQQQPLELKSIAGTDLPIFIPLPPPSLINALKHSVFEHTKHYIYTEVARIIFFRARTAAKAPWKQAFRRQRTLPTGYKQKHLHGT